MSGDFRLGDWTVRPRRECMQRGGETVHVHPKSMQVLEQLAGAGGEVVTREELFRAVWPSVIVTDDSLTQCIVELRKAFGDSAREQKIIKTVPKVGFRLVPPVADIDTMDLPSIAVLPFVNMSANPEQEYFSDGVSEELINLLARTPGLKVISRTSAFSFKGDKVDVPTIARQLGVSHVLEGSVRTLGDRLRITAQLVEARSDTHLWSQTYDREFAEIFAIQDEIARQVVDAVRGALLGSYPRTEAVENLEAYRLFLLGMHHMHKWDSDRARDYFQQAIELEPRYARARLGMMMCFGFETFMGYTSPREGYGKIQVEINSVLASDNKLAEIHRPIAEMNFYFNWDWQAAEESFTRAIRQVPSDAPTYQLYTWFLAAMGRTEEAKVMIARGIELQPLAMQTFVTASNVYYMAGQYEQALAHLVTALELNPGFPMGLSEMGWNYVQMGMFDKAISLMEQSVRLQPGSTQNLWSLGHAYAVAGRTDEARNVLRELDVLSKDQYVLPFGIAVIHAGLGQKDEAIDWLEKAYEERNGWMVYLKVEPRLDPLRAEPRFQELLARMNFPES